MTDPAAETAPPGDPFEGVQAGVMRAALEGIVTVDEHQRIVMINPAAQRMFGCTAAEVLGCELSRLIPARLRDAHVQHVREFDRSGSAERSVYKRRPIVGLRANGEEFPAEATICRVDVAGELGTRRYFTALLRDMSKEQGLKAEIDTLNQRVRAIFELAPVAIWITEADRIVFANRACAALFGVADSATLVDRAIYELLSPESHDSVRRQVARVLANESSPTTISERIARADGTVREVEIAVAAMPDHGRTTVQMAITDITERIRMHRELEQSRRELRQLAASQVDAREEERRRIARELHDELGQRLTALKMELSSLAPAASSAPVSSKPPASPKAPAPAGRIAAMLDMVDETVASVRRIATDLRPAMLDDLGLNAAVEWLARESGRRMGVEVSLRLDDSDPPLSETSSIAVYRMVQEALTNIARHAQATRVQIALTCQRGELLLTVQDNGVGFRGPTIYREGSHGLMGIRERAWMLGGHIEVGNAREGGGRIGVRLPLRSNAPSVAAGGAGVAPTI